MRKENAITLIALTITIIVMLILAGVTINLTLGQNGIFKTAQQAARNYTDAQNKELADLNEFGEIVDKVAQNPEYNPSLLKLKAGDYVKYDTGSAGVKTFRVLYEATSPYGLQIISDKNLEDVTLGGSDWATARDSYNNAIAILNEEAMKYLNTTYATDARCVGSNPANKNAETTTTVTLPRPEWDSSQYKRPNGWISDDTGCKDRDSNCMTDVTAIQKAGVWGVEKNYWLASRVVSTSSSICYFQVYCIGDDGNRTARSFGEVRADGTTFWGASSLGLYPCIILKPDIKVVSGDRKK